MAPNFEIYKNNEEIMKKITLKVDWSQIFI